MLKNDSGFVCENCGNTVPKLNITSRNHCTKCLYSKHLDNTPGDRENKCKGLMKPILVTLSGKKGYIVKHQCIKCGETKNNKSAPDDDFDALIKIQKEIF